MSTNIQKEKARNAGEKAGEKNRKRKDSRGISTQKILKVEESIWEGRIRENVCQKAMGPCNRVERRVCVKEGKSVFTIEREKRRGANICGESATKRVYLTIEITTDLTSPFCSKERQKKENGTRLLSCKPVDSKKQVSLTPNCRYPGWSRKEKGVHKT